MKKLIQTLKNIWSIEDLRGKILFTIQQPTTGAQQIDISTLPAGNYIVKAIGQSQHQAAYFSKL